MKRMLVFLTSVVLAAAPAFGKAKPVMVHLINSQGQDVGTAALTPAGSGVRIQLNLKNLPEGEHGIHIHQNPKCDPPDFKTAGPHLNPAGKEHGIKNPKGAHAGDVPENLKVEADGTDRISLVVNSITLKKDVPNSVFANGGTSLVIHEKADDMMTDPAGNSGPRIACGTIVPQ